jgi:hypothetical protein
MIPTGNHRRSNTDDTGTTDKNFIVLNPPDGVCNTPMSDSYTWSEAERVAITDAACSARLYGVLEVGSPGSLRRENGV